MTGMSFVSQGRVSVQLENGANALWRMFAGGAAVAATTLATLDDDLSAAALARVVVDTGFEDNVAWVEAALLVAEVRGIAACGRVAREGGGNAVEQVVGVEHGGLAIAGGLRLEGWNPAASQLVNVGGALVVLDNRPPLYVGEALLRGDGLVARRHDLERTGREVKCLVCFNCAKCDVSPWLRVRFWLVAWETKHARDTLQHHQIAGTP